MQGNSFSFFPARSLCCPTRKRSFAVVGVPQNEVRRCCVLSAGKAAQATDQQQQL